MMIKLIQKMKTEWSQEYEEWKEAKLCKKWWTKRKNVENKEWWKANKWNQEWRID